MHHFTVPTMTCGGCAKSVTKALLNADPQARIETNPAAGEVKIDSTLAASALLEVLGEAGYPARHN
ncbi:MAG: heavy-metal-associated domain-containing protein [Serratia sp. (in: enterobacteria)]|uniref:heavy-metal-associated domain-containing protein n=1 Tax=Serratia sp. (in: enterobacteria) TaxID=616 RepID=UPI003F2FE789